MANRWERFRHPQLARVVQVYGMGGQVWAHLPGQGFWDDVGHHLQGVYRE